MLIAGDFNAGRFDQYHETFWTTMESGDWDVLADDPSYPSTRMTGTPPGSTVSQIDYVIVSKGNGGLAGDEITQTTANVHTELVAAYGGGLQLRTRASDHLPVTVTLSVTQDKDQPHTRSGTLAEINGLNLDNGLMLQAQYAATAVRLTVVNGLSDRPVPDGKPAARRPMRP